MGQLEKLKSTPEGLALIEGQQLSKEEKIMKALKKVKMQIARAETALDMPAKRSIGPFNLYISEQIKTVAGTSVTEKMSVIAPMYKNLSESEQKALKARTDEMNLKRKSEYEAWASKMASSEKFKNLEELRAKQENLQAKLKDLKMADKKEEAKKAKKDAKKADKKVKTPAKQ